MHGRYSWKSFPTKLRAIFYTLKVSSREKLAPWLVHPPAIWWQKSSNTKTVSNAASKKSANISRNFTGKRIWVCLKTGKKRVIWRRRRTVKTWTKTSRESRTPQLNFLHVLSISVKNIFPRMNSDRYYWPRLKLNSDKGRSEKALILPIRILARLKPEFKSLKTH